jgi:hypothetical protein
MHDGQKDFKIPRQHGPATTHAMIASKEAAEEFKKLARP